MPAGKQVAPEKCSAHKAVKFYAGRIAYWRAKKEMGTGPHPGATPRASHFRAGAGRVLGKSRVATCPRYLAHVLQRKARAAHRAYDRWVEYHWHWSAWLPDKWQRIGACETGYGRRPGNWRHDASRDTNHDGEADTGYEGAFGFAVSSWDAFKYRADPKAGPYPNAAWQATPRQQYEVALAIYRAYGFSGWGCRGA
jgi:hypothetical protein